MKHESTFGVSGYARHEGDKQPGSGIEDKLNREQERDSVFFVDVETLKHSEASGGMSLPEADISRGEDYVAEVQTLLEKHGWNPEYFTEERCEKIMGKFDVSQSARVRATAEVLVAQHDQTFH